jgi:molybdenum cofactor guanylyltransferase
MLGAIILTGGAGRRMGADKAALDWAGTTAVERVAQLASAAGAQVIITVGQKDLGLPNVVDEPRGGGPVAGVAAGVRALREAGCSRALILAVDAPTITLGDLAPLLSHPGPGAAYEGLHLPLVLDIDAVPADAAAGWPMGRLTESAGVARLACPPGAYDRLRGANTPQERRALLAELARRLP